MKEIGGFLKILATRAPDLKAIQAQKEFVILEAPAFCLDSADWREAHDPDLQADAPGKVA